MIEKITSENILEKLRLHPSEQTSQVCLIAGKEIETLRARVKELLEQS